MAKSNADRQKQYRAKKRNAPVTENVTRVTDINSVTRPVFNLDNMTPQEQLDAPDYVAGSTAYNVDSVDGRYNNPPLTSDMEQARARRTNPDSLNWGKWMTMTELKQAGLKANRVSIPGDWGYIGVAV